MYREFPARVNVLKERNLEAGIFTLVPNRPIGNPLVQETLFRAPNDQTAKRSFAFLSRSQSGDWEREQSGKWIRGA